ncbi:hypothetical protein HQN89_27495 [Paenibacillus frigoriresistens]|nr:hypothetical protein [Paenibacillus frigoriresistens]
MLQTYSLQLMRAHLPYPIGHGVPYSDLILIVFLHLRILFPLLNKLVEV